MKNVFDGKLYGKDTTFLSGLQEDILEECRNFGKVKLLKFLG